MIIDSRSVGGSSSTLSIRSVRSEEEESTFLLFQLGVAAAVPMTPAPTNALVSDGSFGLNGSGQRSR